MEKIRFLMAQSGSKFIICIPNFDVRNIRRFKNKISTQSKNMEFVLSGGVSADVVDP